MTNLVYLARPVDQVKAGITPPWLVVTDWIDVELALHDVVVFRPAEAFRMQGALDPIAGVEQINRAALAAADVVIAVLPSATASIGVPREIEAALAAGTPVAVVSDIARAFSLADTDLCVPMTTEGVREVAGWAAKQPSKASRAASGVDRAGWDGDTPVIRFAPLGGADYDGTLWPTRAHRGDAGWDLFVSERTVIPVGQHRDVPTGVRAIIPEGVWLRIVGRSSTTRNHGLIVTEGVIDTGWRGPLFAGATNVGRETVILERGDRIAQVIPHLNLAPEMGTVAVPGDWFDAQPPHDDRGTNGFGSTGR